MIGLPEGHSQYFLLLKMLKSGAIYLLGIWVQFFHLRWEMVMGTRCFSKVVS